MKYYKRIVMDASHVRVSASGSGLYFCFDAANLSWYYVNKEVANASWAFNVTEQGKLIGDP